MLAEQGKHWFVHDGEIFDQCQREVLITHNGAGSQLGVPSVRASPKLTRHTWGQS